MTRPFYFFLLLLCLSVACKDDTDQVSVIPTNEALRLATTLEGVGGKDQSMAVGTLKISFTDEVLKTATKVSLRFQGIEVASSSTAPFNLSFDTKTIPDHAYAMQVIVTYADGAQREVEYQVKVANVLLKLTNNLFDYESGHADDYGQRVAITDKNGNVLDWQDVREGGDFVFYAPEGFFDETIGLNAIHGDETNELSWLAYTDIPRGMSWTNTLAEERARYGDHYQQDRIEFQVDCASNCPSEGMVFFSSSERGFVSASIDYFTWPYQSGLYINQTDPYMIGGIRNASGAEWGNVSTKGLNSFNFNLSQFRTYTAQKKQLNGKGSSAEVYLKLAANQRWPIALSLHYWLDNDPNASTASYLLPNANDVEGYMMTSSWEVDKTNAASIDAHVGITAFNTELTDPRPVSALRLNKVAYSQLEASLTDPNLATFVIYTWYDQDSFDGEGEDSYQYDFGNGNFKPIQLSQVFKEAPEGAFNDIVLTDISVHYLPGMTKESYLDFQKDSFFPIVDYPFFYNLQEVRWYDEYINKAAEEGKAEGRSKRMSK